MKKKYSWLSEGQGSIAIGGRPSLQLLDLLKTQHCNVVITLLRESEYKIAEEIGNKTKEIGMEWIWLPLSASELPKGVGVEKVRTVMYDLSERLAKGDNIFIHCAAGIHRTGAFTYALLRYLGNDSETAKNKINEMRPITFRDAQAKHWAWGEQFGNDAPKTM